MATYAIGDVHGNLAALDDLFEKIRGELSAADTVVFLGDCIDRGPDSKGSIESILRFWQQTPATVVALAGNHEDWLVKTLRDFSRHSWLLGMKAVDTIASYSAEAAAEIRKAAEEAGIELITGKVVRPYETFVQAVPRSHLTFLERLVPFHRTADALCVHGGLDPGAGPAERQPREALIWGCDDFLRRYSGPELVVYGHWDNDATDGEGWPGPVFGKASIGIDTISHGVLTAVRLPDRRVFQSARFAGAAHRA